MELERDQIERRDFAQARRGYDPDEVDRHLTQVAKAVEELRKSQSSAPEADPAPMAAAAAEQVRSIVEAAERSAADIESSAQSEADRMLSEAKREAENERNAAATEAEEARTSAAAEARRTREQAESDSREHLARVQEATAAMTSRADKVESDLNRLVDDLRSSIASMLDSVRTNAGSLESELIEIQAGLAVVRGAPDEEDQDEPEPESAVEESEELEELAEEAEEDYVAEEGEVTREYAVEDIEAELDRDEPTLEEQPEEEPLEASDEGGEGARLIALNMALNGTPREETARYLDENFDLDDPEGILDEVYARVGG